MKTPLISSAWVLCTLLASPIAAQERATGFDNAQRNAITAELVKIAPRHGPGCVVGVQRTGDDPYVTASGRANIEWERDLDASTIFDIASNSKQFAAAVIFQLEAEGKLRLNDDIRKHLPELPATSTVITIYHLLHHTSGLRDVDGLRMLSRTHDETTVTTDDVEALIRRQQGVNFAAGSDFAYSNTNYILLAKIAEKLDGKAYPDLLQQRLFGPLGLRHTRQKRSYGDVVPRLATPYAMQGEQPAVLASNWVVYGTGFIQSNISDMLRWLSGLLVPSGPMTRIAPKLLSTASLSNGTVLGYTAGLVSDSYRGVPRFFHNGGSGGYRSSVNLYPSRGLVTAVLCNSGSVLPNHLSDRIADIVLDKLHSNSTFNGRARSVPSGIYHAAGQDAYRWIETGANGSLKVKTTLNDPGRDYKPMGEGLYVEPASSSKLIVAGRGPTLTLHMDDNLKDLNSYVPVIAVRADDISQYMGSYHSSEVDVRISVTRDETGPILSLEPSEQFMRASDTVQVRMQRLPDGAYATTNGWILRFNGSGNATITLGRLVRFPLTGVPNN